MSVFTTCTTDQLRDFRRRAAALRAQGVSPDPYYGIRHLRRRLELMEEMLLKVLEANHRYELERALKGVEGEGE